MGKRRRRQVLLTFDVEGVPPEEDSLDGHSLMCLHRSLDMLDEYDFKGIFFIAATVAKQIRTYPKLVRQLSQHRIGYHSASHSRSLPIIHCTDVPDYGLAVENSTRSESSEADPISQTHNLQILSEVFPRNVIDCFRAPFLVWTPPYLEALRTLGIRFDFSSYMSDTPVTFKGITFYPGPITIDDTLATFITKADPRSTPKLTLGQLFQRSVSVLHFHPSSLLFHRYLHSRKGNRFRGQIQVKLAISMLHLLLKRIDILRRNNLVEVTSSLSQGWPVLKPEEIDIGRVYWLGVKNAVTHFNYQPRFVRGHFMHFFDREDPISR